MVLRRTVASVDKREPNNRLLKVEHQSNCRHITEFCILKPHLNSKSTRLKLLPHRKIAQLIQSLFWNSKQSSGLSTRGTLYLLLMSSIHWIMNVELIINFGKESAPAEEKRLCICFASSRIIRKADNISWQTFGMNLRQTRNWFEKFLFGLHLH